MCRGILSQLCLLGLVVVIYVQFVNQWPCAAAARYTVLQLEKSVIQTKSPVISGEKIQYKVKITHKSISEGKAVDAVLVMELPLFLRFNSYDTGAGRKPTSFQNTSHKLEFKFNAISLSQEVDLTFYVDADPYFLHGKRDILSQTSYIDFTYYGVDGPDFRPASRYNAERIKTHVNVKLLAVKACDQCIETTLGAPIEDNQYFASSFSSDMQAYRASMSKTGVWKPAAHYLSDRNQFLQIDFKRLIKINKIETRGMVTPSVAFVRSYHLYYSKDLLDWTSYRENDAIKEFKANVDGTNAAGSFLRLPIVARYIRIVPRSWKKFVAMKVQIYGCSLHPVPTLRDFCPIFDFENGLSGWTKTGTAFDNQPTLGDNLFVRTGQSANIEGNGWIATAEDRTLQYDFGGNTQGDGPKGTLTSPKFLLGAKKLFFLIGGTAASSKVRAELLVDGAVVRMTRGTTESLTEKQWNVTPFLGKEARLRLVDDATGGHLNFDALRMDCYLDADAQDIVLPDRSILLNPTTHVFYVCDSSHTRYQADPRCRMTGSGTNQWTDIPHVLGLLGVDSATNNLYAVSNDRYIMEHLSQTSGQRWRYITLTEWNELKFLPTMVLASQVVWSSDNSGFDEILRILSDNNGDKWRATKYGIGFKAAGQHWTTIASWLCYVADISTDPCVSAPCVHSSSCVNPSPGVYNCTCLPGFSGTDCEIDIDYCVDHDCQNDARCVDSFTEFFCICKYGYTGTKCETELSACLTTHCFNGGTCVDLGSGNFECNCLSGYRGMYCEILFDACSEFPCRNGGQCFSQDGVSTTCVCPQGFYGSSCEHGYPQYLHNFLVLETKSVTETYEYKVIKATLPSSGRSLNKNWCVDYDKLCSAYQMQPTGFGRSYNHLKGHASCQENYFARMDDNNILGGKPNEKVAELAVRAGFSGATADNCFAFNQCDEDKCSDELPSEGCDRALGCISMAVPNLEVYTLCISFEHNYRVSNYGWVNQDGINLFLMIVRPSGHYSKGATWCHDYQKLCDASGLRPIGEHSGLCQKKYNAFRYHLGKDGIVAASSKIHYTGHGFNMRNCISCSSSYCSTSALYHQCSLTLDYAVACSKLHDTSFKVLDQKQSNVNGFDYLAIKVQVPASGKSTSINWCKDYQTLCESYGRKPLGCGHCPVTYKASTLENAGMSCSTSNNQIRAIANTMGFTEATDANSFALNDCIECSATISDGTCGSRDIFCLDQSNPHRVLYTVCLFRMTVLPTISVKQVNYGGKPFLIITTELPANGQYGELGMFNWCEEYQELCLSNGAQPTGCGSNYSTDPLYSSCRDDYDSYMHDDVLGCGSSSKVVDVINAANIYSAYDYNILAFHQCSPTNCSTQLTYASCTVNCTHHPSFSTIGNKMRYNKRKGYAVCRHVQQAVHAFVVLDTSTTTFNDKDVLVIKARLPSDGAAVQEDWCEDYRRLCMTYSFRPTACGSDYEKKTGHELCRSRYDAVMSTDNEYSCPADNTIATIAQSVGFSSADTTNSFALSDCSKRCVKKLTTDINSLIDISVVNGEVYTVCSSSNSNFKVFTTDSLLFNGGRYKFIEARVPTHFISKHVDWCTDYERMCESFGLRPVGLHGRQTIEEYMNCIQRHQAVNPMNIELTTRDEVYRLASRLGYSQAYYHNSFTLKRNCDSNCVNDMKLNDNAGQGVSHLSYTYIQSNDYRVYTTCSSSDSNFRVMSTKSIEYNGQTYLVVMAQLPSKGKSKYASWCTDYERLCRTFNMRPTGCGLSYQRSSKYRSCVEKFQSAMADNDALGCGSSEKLASVANAAGFEFASANNSFMFHQCSDTCPNQLGKDCPNSLHCLSNNTDVVYTACADSSSAFIVRYVEHTRQFDLPLVVLGATLAPTTQPKSNNWCVDYQKLCSSFAARPVSCHPSWEQDYHKCPAKYDAIPLEDTVQRCSSSGIEDIKHTVHSRRSLTEGHYFKFSKCSMTKCEAPVSYGICHDALYCLATWLPIVYGICSRSSNNFQVVSTKTTSYGNISDILVVKATIPSDGQSLYDSWCEDYDKLCSVYGMRPLACPLPTDDVTEAPCEKNFHGYLLKNTSCPLHELVAEIANDTGFNTATARNSFALSTCQSCSKTLQMVSSSDSTPYISLSSVCPPDANCSQWTVASTPYVHTLCVKPPQVSGFIVKESKRVRANGRNFIALLVSISNNISPHGNWCTDYKKLCESVSMRPIACGSYYSYRKTYRSCRIKYNAIMPYQFKCNSANSLAPVMVAAGFGYDSPRTFTMFKCEECGAEFRHGQGLANSGYNEGTLYTACVSSEGGFDVQQTSNFTLDNRNFLVIKALLPEDMISTHENWCRDYQLLCESYGKRPLTCPDLGECKYSYNALTSSVLKCDMGNSNLRSIANDAGFPGATDENTFVFRSCESNDCSRRFPSDVCGPFGCVNSSVLRREVYTLCLGSNTAYEVLATKSKVYENRNYLVIQVKVPDSLTANGPTWCHDYATLCNEFGYRPGTCHNGRCVDTFQAMVMDGQACPVTSTGIADISGMTEVKSETTFGLSANCYNSECKKVASAENCTANGKYPIACYDRTLNDGEFTTLCTKPHRQTHFPSNDYKPVDYAGRRYLVIRTRKTISPSEQTNWCYDYESLCEGFRMQPLACPAKYMYSKTRHMCIRKYKAVSMETTDYGCPLNDFVAELARIAGYPKAMPWNSFAFNDCEDKYCSNYLKGDECNEALYCLNSVGDNHDVHTVCTSSDSSFKVVDVKRSITYTDSEQYTVVKVYVKDTRSLSDNWCQDYRRLCELYEAVPIECYQDGQTSSSFVCRDSYGAERMPCGNPSTAYKIAIHAGFPTAKSTNTMVMQKCNNCPKEMPTTCTSSLKCTQSPQLYAVCYQRARTFGQLKVLRTEPLSYGQGSYLLVQAELGSRYHVNCINEYISLCRSFGYLAIASGRTATSASSQRQYCETHFAQDILISENDDFSQPVYKTIALLAREHGFYNAEMRNSFGLDRCSYEGTRNLYSGSCSYHEIPCLNGYPTHGQLYTMCAKPAPAHVPAFEVLDKKTLRALDQNYLAVKVRINPDGVAFLDNWCLEYRELCRQFNMVPTGCGKAMKIRSSYRMCETKYDSFMAHSNILKCKNVEIPATIARQAGFPNASKLNTFVFNDCSKCSKRLDYTSEFCNSALYCLHKDVWNKEAYGLCVDRQSGFEVLDKAEITYANAEYLVIEAALPSDSRAVSDNWCQDYQKLCFSYGKFPVACAADIVNNKFSEKYGAAVVSNLACAPSQTVKNIAKMAGYLAAKTGNSFVFGTPTSDACQKKLPVYGCAKGLDCLNAATSKVYTLCTNPTNFEVAEMRTSRYMENTFTVVKARLPATALSKSTTWCQDYTKLCHVINQRPVVCGRASSYDGQEKCAVDYDAYVLSRNYECSNGTTKHLYSIAQRVGFSKASYSNTLAMKDCSSGICQNKLHDGPECDASLNCVNTQAPDGDVYALCLKEKLHSNFDVMETKEITSMNVFYLAIKARLPKHGKSKRETWCKDYERMCTAHEMRPVRCSTQTYPDCIGQFKALIPPAGNLDCNNKTKLVQLLRNAGFNAASSQNSFTYSACSTSLNCQKTLPTSQCDSSLNCLQSPVGDRLVYTVCARSLVTSFIYREARSAFFHDTRYLVIKVSMPPDRISTNENWCYDYRDMCASFGKRPVVRGSLNDRNPESVSKIACFNVYNGTSTHASRTDLTAIGRTSNFNVQNCVMSLNDCHLCQKTLDYCPFASCGCSNHFLVCL